MNPSDQKIGLLRTSWIILASLAVTANTCILAIIKRLQGKVPRQWVDATMQRWTKRVLRLVRVHLTIKNPHQVKPQKGQPTIIMCNHSSLYDIPLSFAAFPTTSIRMLAKIELSRIPLFGSAMRAGEFPFIDRKNRHQAIKDLKAVHTALQQGIVLWMAPEGTRTNDGQLSAFKKGGFITAIETKATIIPIGIRGASGILPARTLHYHLNQSVDIHIGQPIDASTHTLEHKDVLMNQVHASMRQLLGETD